MLYLAISSFLIFPTKILPISSNCLQKANIFSSKQNCTPVLRPFHSEATYSFLPSCFAARCYYAKSLLSYDVQALETKKKLEQVNGAMAMTLDKLPTIRGDLVRTEPEWENWDFCKLVEALRQWTKRNPQDDAHGGQNSARKRDTLFHASPGMKPRGCIYCDSSEHKANDCSKVTSVPEHKQILTKRRLYFNCACGNHKAPECAR